MPVLLKIGGTSAENGQAVSTTSKSTIRKQVMLAIRSGCDHFDFQARGGPSLGPRSSAQSVSESTGLLRNAAAIIPKPAASKPNITNVLNRLVERK
jgi:hypothetical protein